MYQSEHPTNSFILTEELKIQNTLSAFEKIYFQRKESCTSFTDVVQSKYTYQCCILQQMGKIPYVALTLPMLPSKTIKKVIPMLQHTLRAPTHC
jgi:hypothetical protein